MPSDRKDTLSPYEKIWATPVGQQVCQYPVLCAVTVSSALIGMAGASRKSPLFSHVSEKGLVPAGGAALSILGALALHDAIMRKAHPSFGTRLKRIVPGTMATLAGAQIVGQSYGITGIKNALIWPIAHCLDHPRLLGSLSLFSVSVKSALQCREYLSKARADQEQKSSNTLKVGVSAAAAAASFLGALEVYGASYDLQALVKRIDQGLDCLLASKPAGIFSSAVLMLSAVSLMKSAFAKIQMPDQKYEAIARELGALSCVLAGIEVMARTLSDGQSKHFFLDNTSWLFGQALGLTSAAGFTDTLERIQSQGFTGRQGLALAITLAGFGAGSAMILQARAPNLSEKILDGTQIGFGLVLSLAALGFAKQVLSRSEGAYLETRLWHGSLSLGSLLAGTAIMNDMLHNAMLTEITEKLADGLDCVNERIISPWANFLYGKPLGSAILTSAIVGAIMYLRNRKF